MSHGRLTTTAFVALGANLGLPQVQLASALCSLAALENTRLLGVSPFYRSPALAAPGAVQPDYCNAVALLRTALSAPDLLQHLLEIEKQHGRVRSPELRWQPRPLDLDLLLYGQQTFDMPHLCVPHPEIANRRFVLQPWFDLSPDCCIPGFGSLAALLAQNPDAPLQSWLQAG